MNFRGRRADFQTEGLDDGKLVKTWVLDDGKSVNTLGLDNRKTKDTWGLDGGSQSTFGG